MDLGAGFIVPSLASNKAVMQEVAHFTITIPGMVREANKMDEKKGEKLKILLNDIDKEFHGLNHMQRAKFAIEQISMWQNKFNEAKGRILKENIIDAFPAGGIVSQYPEIEA